MESLARDPAAKPRLVYVLTHAMSTRFLRGQVSYLRGLGYEITLIAAPDHTLDEFAREQGVRVISVPLTRRISPWADLRALLQLIKLLRWVRPELVNAGTPKAGLLGMIAAFVARVPVRIYVLRGLRLETCRGWRRAVLWSSEWLAARFAHQVICVSHSLREAFVRERLAPPGKTRVLGAGSSNGVDLSRFQFTRQQTEQASRLRGELNIPAAARVVGYVGRLTRDKGVGELLEAFHQLRRRDADPWLLLVGGPEAEDALPAELTRRMAGDPRIVVTGFVKFPELYYQLMDLVVLPSYREGFPNVVLEASAAGLPVVGFDATGTRDAILDGVTGRLVPPGDVRALAQAIDTYLRDATLRRLHGHQARERASREFRQEVVWQHLAGLYLRALTSRGCRLPRPSTQDTLSKAA